MLGSSILGHMTNDVPDVLVVTWDALATSFSFFLLESIGTSLQVVRERLAFMRFVVGVFTRAEGVQCQ